MYFTGGLFSVFEYIGVVSFALYGAQAAIQKKMDLFGISIMAFTGACGGGILRDVIMDVGVPAFFSSYSTILAVLLSVYFKINLPVVERT